MFITWGNASMSDSYRVHNELERLIVRQTGKHYGRKNDETPAHPRIMGRLPDATSSARVTGPCGETIEMYLKIRDDLIEDARFYTDGCGASVLCAYVAAKLAIGRMVEDAAVIGEDTIIDILGSLPEDHKHCALLAAETLRAAIHNYMAEPAFREHTVGGPEP